MLKKAIKSGADINQNKKGGRPLIFIAVLDNDPELLSYLPSAGTDPRQKINDPGKPNHGQDILSYLDTRNYLRSEDDTEIKKILRAALSEDSYAQP